MIPLRRYAARAIEPAAQPFPRPFDMDPLVYDVLISRGITDEDQARRFLSPSMEDLHDPFLLSDMHTAVEILRRHVENASPITVYGDYDVDGVTASSILYTHLRSLNANVEVYLPSRHHEGYGLNDDAIREIAGRSRLLVTVDCGISNAPQIALAKQLGLECIVTDHHRPPEILPDCPTVNPLLNGYPFPSLCGAGTAFQLVRALSGDAAAEKVIDLAAIGTVADLVPLQDENRVITHFGLEAINRMPRLGVRALIAAAGLAGKPIRAHHIAFQLAPRINASGRIGSAKIAFQLLTGHDEAEAEELALFLNQENEQRKQLEQQILHQAESQLENYDFVRNHVIAIVGEGWNEGVIGLAASKILEQYHMPVMVFSRSGDIMVGSCRSIEAVNIHAALTVCADLFLRFGGHKAAAGLTLKAENFRPMLERINEYIEQNCDMSLFTPVSVYDCAPDLRDLTLSAVHALDCFQPTGMGNPAPLFLAEGDMVNWRTIGSDNKHLKFELADESGRHDAVAFGLTPTLHKPVGGRYRMVFSPKENTYAGRTTIQMEIKALSQAVDAARESELARSAPRMQRKFLQDRLSSLPENAAAAGSTLSQDQLLNLLNRTTQGTLVLCADAAAALSLIRACGCIHEVFVGAYPQDRIGHNAVCILPCGPLPPDGVYHTVVSVDLPPNLLPFGRVSTCRMHDQPWLRQLPDIAALRAVYSAARKILGTDARPADHLARSVAAAAGLSEVSACAGIAVYVDLKLFAAAGDAAGNISMAPMKKINPETGAVYRALCAAREWASIPYTPTSQTGGITDA